MRNEESKGHIKFSGNVEFYMWGESIYCAPRSNIVGCAGPMTGIRDGRWECYIRDREYFLSETRWPTTK